MGGGGGFLAGVAGGPTALVTGGAGAAEGWALGTAGGAVAGKALGRAIGGALLYFAARASGGSRGSSGGGTDCRKPSEILRQNLIDAGMETSPGDEAHHIVPDGHHRAGLARDLLDAFGIHINSAANGVFLPGPEGEGEGVPHRTTHTYASIDFVTDLLVVAPDRAGAEAALDLVRQLLKSGVLP